MYAIRSYYANPTSEPISVGLRVDSSINGNRGRQASVAISSGSTVRWLMPVGAKNGIIGMQGQPPIDKTTGNDVLVDNHSVEINPKKIEHFQLFMSKPEKDYRNNFV